MTVSCVQLLFGFYLPDQSPVLHIILSSEVDDHRRAKLVNALEKKKKTQLEILAYCLKQAGFNISYIRQVGAVQNAAKEQC